jgi:hypothetical protein
MRALVTSRQSRGMQLEMALEDFLDSGRMACRAKAAMCSPDDLILDYLPAFDAGDADEVREAFGEACEQAVDGEIGKVQLDDDDVLFVREHFLNDRRFRITQGWLPEAA